MTDLNFLYWLRGYLEDKNWSDIDLKMIMEHLALVTCKEMQATVFIEGLLMGFDISGQTLEMHCPLYTTLSGVVSGVIQEVESGKKEELVKAVYKNRAAGRGLFGGFSGGLHGLKIC